jgi:Predicted metal-binding, possibly nucleic acid-binding protein
MLLYLSEITESKVTRDVEYNIAGDELGENAKIKNVSLKVEFYRAAETICLRFFGNATVLTACDRCLADLELDMDLDETYYLFPENTPDVDYFYSGDEIELDDYVRETLVMNMPGKVLCSEDCKGLCSKCGADLNLGDCGCDRSGE